MGIWHFLLVINSNLGPVSHRLRDMASFPLKNNIFAIPPFTLKFENIFLHCIAQILYAESLDTELIIRVKSSPLE